MTEKPADTRRLIVEAADRLFYEHGYGATSFADIAAATGLSRGNFYYHFRTKDQILNAVIDARAAGTRDMIAGWEADSHNPRDRIRSFAHILVRNQHAIMAFGCPLGTLSDELAKLDHPAKSAAAQLFLLFRSWLAGQFRALDCADESDALAVHVLMRSQGIATLATAFRDPAMVERELADLDGWLDTALAAYP